MEDASLVSDAPADRRLRVEVELREALGSDLLVHFRIAAPPAMTEDAKELASELGPDALARVQQQARGGESVVVARLNPRSRAAKGELVELVVDTHRMHFFDPDTGSGIYRTTSTTNSTNQTT
jgi:multiple sugar transport system ATP-binding protein